MVLKDGFKMSKSKGNIVDPDEVIAEYGADALRLFMIFAAPIEKEIDWTGFEGIDGATRFLRRVCRMVDEHTVTAVPVPSKERLTIEEKTLLVKVHQTLHKVTDDLSQRYQFNTLVSSLMEFANALHDLPADAPNRSPIMQHCLEIFVKMLSPAAPHTAEQLWEQLDGSGFCMHAPWPESDPAWLQADEMIVVVQVNGKVRGRILMPSAATEAERKAAALACPEAQNHLSGKEVVKVVVPPGGKLVSIVVKG
jgi:leucyl-tRNA synthetase